MEHIVWDFNPILVSFMGLTVHWYGALFALAIATGFQVLKHMFKKEGLDVESLDNFLVYCVVGIIVGARLAHCVFYDPGYYFANPLKILAIWEGGLASHGGGLGAILALYYYQRQVKLPFLFLLDRLAISTAIFGFFVRMANFANSEILGEPTNCSKSKYGQKCFYSVAETEIVFINGKADWITVEGIDNIPFNQKALKSIGIAPATPSFKNNFTLRWTSIQGFKEVSIFKGATNSDYAYIKAFTE